jgi:hypothetical protein
VSKKAGFLGVSGPVGNPTFKYAYPKGYGYSFGSLPAKESFKPRQPSFGGRHLVGAGILVLGIAGLVKFFTSRARDQRASKPWQGQERTP